MSTDWKLTVNQPKFSFSTRNAVFTIEHNESEYFIVIRNTEFAPTNSYIKLTREEFGKLAQEIYKLWEPRNIVEALDKLT